jgi:hypothetical protein
LAFRPSLPSCAAKPDPDNTLNLTDGNARNELFAACKDVESTADARRIAAGQMERIGDLTGIIQIS